MGQAMYMGAKKTDPNALAPNAALGSVIVKIGKAGEPFQAFTDRSDPANEGLRIRENDEVYIAINDSNFVDNRGAHLVVVEGGDLNVNAEPGPNSQSSSSTEGTSGQNYKVTLRATDQQLDTHIQVGKGQTITISATGRINGSSTPGDGAYKWVGPEGWGYDPDFNRGRKGPLPRGQSLMVLCARIGVGQLPINDGMWRVVGARAQLTAPDDGTIHLTVNDVNDPTGAGDWWSDNQGELSITIVVN